MGRVTNALLDGRAYSRGSSTPVLDPTYGGQMGYSPDLTEWVSNQAYVRRNVIPILLEAPRFFRLLQDSDVWVRNLRAIVERHPRVITGLNRGLTVTTEETLVGGGGEMQEEVTDVKRARSQPVFEYDEKYGAPFRAFFHDWITYGLMDPDTKVANIGTLAGNRPTDMLADQYAATMIFIEPDPTHQKVVNAFLSTNMYPKATGDILGGREIGSAMQLNQISIEWSAITQTGLGVNAFAQRLLNNINITNANPFLRPAFIQGIAPDVEAQANTGYKAQAEQLGRTAITTP